MADFSELTEARNFWADNALDGYRYVLLLTGEDSPPRDKLLGGFAEKLRGSGRRAAVVSSDISAGNSCYDAIAASSRVVEGIIALYSLYAFTDKLIIGSFDKPHGRKLRNLLDGGAATEEELINDVILGVMDGSKA